MLISAFWKSTGAVYRQQYHTNDIDKESGLMDALFHMPAARVAWTCAVFLLCYVGIEVALGGWIVLFMIDVRNGGEFESGMSAMGFWLGITVGRVVLGFVTARAGIKLSTSVSDLHTLVMATLTLKGSSTSVRPSVCSSSSGWCLSSTSLLLQLPSRASSSDRCSLLSCWSRASSCRGTNTLWSLALRRHLVAVVRLFFRSSLACLPPESVFRSCNPSF